MKTKILPVIIAGGIGTRLWPLSRKNKPKQLLKLNSNKTMLQETLSRLDGLNFEPPSIICNEEHRFMVAEQIRSIDKEVSNIILEPEVRDTAPAIALACLNELNAERDPIILIMAADHIVKDVKSFHQSVLKGIDLVEKDKIVTFGVIPTNPNTGYGYIKKQDKSSGAVECFVEKPCKKMAQKYFNSGEYLWNSGMFMFRASRYIRELGIHREDILNACKSSMKNTSKDIDFTRIDEESFRKCPSESIDYAVMENANDVWVVALDAGWSDVGNWMALWDEADKDKNNNTISGDVIAHKTTNCYLRSESRLVASLGISDMVVVETKDAVLVANSNDIQDVKFVVDQLKSAKRSEHETHREVFRPWGKYDSVDSGERYQVKRITVKPGQKLSVQMHHHRAEHWIVVSGTAKVLRGKEELMLSENESIYIPLGTIHALENPGKVDLQVIEVQSGSYLGEDDIVRLEDQYGRS